MANQSWTQLICTVGPASLNPRVLSRMEQLGVDLFRINLSHTSLDQLGTMIHLIRSSTSVPLCIDTEGPQIRTGRMAGDGEVLRKGDLVRLVGEEVLGDREAFSLTPREVFQHLEAGTLLKVDFHEALLKVVARISQGEGVLAEVRRGGRVGNNKAVVANRHIPLPNLSQKDRQAIAVARGEGIAVFALSFANHETGVGELRAAAGDSATIIAKIESRMAVTHLDGIVRAADAILIDRGDFSREVPFERLPLLQRLIVAKAHRKPVPVYVATNLLESMVLYPRPTRTEVTDLINILLDGANGLVLAAETAIGKYPVQCVSMVRRLIRQHEQMIERQLHGAQSVAPLMHRAIARSL